MFDLKRFKNLIVMLACLTACSAYGTEVIDRSGEYLRMRQMQVDINLQHNMMQDQVNALYRNQNTYYTPARPSQNEVNTQDYNRPTYVIDRPLYKFGE